MISWDSTGCHVYGMKIFKVCELINKMLGLIFKIILEWDREILNSFTILLILYKNQTDAARLGIFGIKNIMSIFCLCVLSIYWLWFSESLVCYSWIQGIFIADICCFYKPPYCSCSNALCEYTLVYVNSTLNGTCLSCCWSILIS